MTTTTANRVWICKCSQRNPLNLSTCLRLGCTGRKPTTTPATILATGPL